MLIFQHLLYFVRTHFFICEVIRTYYCAIFNVFLRQISMLVISLAMKSSISGSVSLFVLFYNSRFLFRSFIEFYRIIFRLTFINGGFCMYIKNERHFKITILMQFMKFCMYIHYSINLRERHS